ncbi:unnamed protein product [Lepeophtheirus salmonis]|uniref:(salmon louse) hypothetical protein n=1 Tax=Lepeophtheirus salmonis TaxID=72036 RepID=A0A7R8CAI9_LEPSM|nr:unnamed protein product [Lepeophtheirus salmonis]CAF2750046.1 unnamed protein product [Lepeophtheirus salmonis]
MFNKRYQRCTAVQLIPSTDPSYNSKTIVITLKMQVRKIKHLRYSSTLDRVMKTNFSSTLMVFGGSQHQSVPGRTEECGDLLGKSIERWNTLSGQFKELVDSLRSIPPPTRTNQNQPCKCEIFRVSTDKSRLLHPTLFLEKPKNKRGSPMKKAPSPPDYNACGTCDCEKRQASMLFTALDIMVSDYLKKWKLCEDGFIFLQTSQVPKMKAKIGKTKNTAQPMDSLKFIHQHGH